MTVAAKPANAARSAFVALIALVTVAAVASDVGADDASGRDAAIIAALRRAYPTLAVAPEANGVRTRNGALLAFSANGGLSEFPRNLDSPTLVDMFRPPYPWGAPVVAPTAKTDPGRAKVAALFDELYGDCRKGEVERHLVSVPWLPSKRGGVLRVTRLNGVAEALAAVSRELDALPPGFDRFLLNPAGGYNCRDVAGARRKSGHGWGIAVDIASGPADYWRWSSGGSTREPREGADGLVFRNRVPVEIVSIFEKHGFIWGGRWYHFDTMHFEYRPELLNIGSPVP